ncbi:hypothetical protein GQ53DRAFT_836820 [Thozetella sp. PMI_491]|nr:hypothetical protein GQ53DRAFT_836820 [Thozetella sp. PMI_491]
MRLALVRSAVLCCFLSSAAAKLLKWSPDYEDRRWAMPAETVGVALDGVAAPEPTLAPRAASSDIGVKMSTSTCGYVSGLANRNLTCGNLAVCGYDDTSSFIDCCAATGDCRIRTVCYDSTDRSLWSTDNGYTKWCGDADFPHCMTHTYQGSDYSGYTLLWCNVAQGTRPIYYEAQDTATSTDSSSSASSTANPPTTTSDGSGAASTSSTTSTPNASSSSGSSTPVGAIVGGVIGGVALLALLGFLGWFIYHRTHRQAYAPPPAVQSPGPDGYFPTTTGSPSPYPGGTPQMAPAWGPPQQAQQGYYAPSPYSVASEPKPYNPYDPAMTNMQYQQPAAELPVDTSGGPRELDGSQYVHPQQGHPQQGQHQ